MAKQTELDFSPPKTLADYPLITKKYEQASDQWLPVYQKEMAKRVDKPITPWDPLFAHLHLEAIELEMKKRNMPIPPKHHESHE